VRDRERGADPVGDDALGLLESAEVCATRRCGEQQAVRSDEGGVGEGAVLDEGLRERRRLERDDDFDVAGRGSCRGRG
jgi:hypothetical protein